MLEAGPPIPVVPITPHARSIGDMLRRRARATPDLPALYDKSSGEWEVSRWKDVYARAASVAAGLLELGLERGDRVAILGPTRPAWATYDLGAQLAGMVSLGIYPQQAVEQIRYLVEHSEAKVVFVADRDELERVLEATKEMGGVSVVPWKESDFEALSGAHDRLRSPRSFEGEPMAEARVDEVLGAIDPDETAILVYTSGTTGPPKGAMISHNNIFGALAHQTDFLPLRQDDLSFHFLPMAHVAERVLGFYGRINLGVAGAYATSMGTVLEELAEVQPTLFGSVPRIFEKAYDKIHSEVGKKSSTVQSIFEWAKGVGRRVVPYRLAEQPLPLGLSISYRVADAVVFRKVRAAFGGRVRYFVTGAAPIAPEILEFFWGAGLRIFEAFGMTEATVITHANGPGRVKLGTVGQVIGEMEHKIADDGEVLLRGPLVFLGYYKNPEATAETIVDGWLHTGDIGTIDDEGFLRITDRKKHLIITAGGKNLSPANIENAIKKQDPLISQVHAHGDRRNFVSALIAPSPLDTLELGVELGLLEASEAEARTRELMANPSARSEALAAAMAKVVTHPKLVERVRAAVKRGNGEIAQVERVRRFVILERDFSQEQGELTPTMKVKRQAVEKMYAETLDRIYDEAGFALEP